MKILSINAGSSSLKFQVFNMPEEESICSGLVERIGLEVGGFTLKFNGEKFQAEQPIPNHQVAAELVLNGLLEHKVVESIDEIAGVGHRVLHGGEIYKESIVVDEDVKRVIDELKVLGPLHNPANLIGIEAFSEALPNVKHVAVFDTTFHQTMKEENYLYPIPYEYYEKYSVRKYGFHGTSHKFVSQTVAELMGKRPEETNVITLHLGNGASLAAVEGGKCVNTSMGLTPLAGIMMGTRCGDVDPSIITFLMDQTGKSAHEIVDEYNKKSGMLGVSGISSDARDIQAGVDEGNPRAILTQNMYAERCSQTVGSYFVQLGHVDALVFTGGIGENDTVLREEILKRLEEAMGLDVNYELNSQVRGKNQLLSNEGSKSQVWIVPTNEELVIARDTYGFITA